tara:strand:+ start:1620 stop:2222 length:603 start_codon:yes stop_codon:yes gene_type:complete
MSTHTIPAGHGHAFRAETGQRFRLATPKGQQSADFFAFCADDMSEGLSPHHSWMPTRALHPRPGDTFLSRKRRPMVAFIEDGAEGVHDLLIAPCDPIRYTEFGAPEHRSCIGNMTEALAALGLNAPDYALAINFFTATTVEDGFMFNTPTAPIAKPGAYVILEARTDLVCAVSSCPYDLTGPGWTINSPDGPTEIEVEML